MTGVWLNFLAQLLDIIAQILKLAVRSPHLANKRAVRANLSRPGDEQLKNGIFPWREVNRFRSNHCCPVREVNGYDTAYERGCLVWVRRALAGPF